MFKNKKIKYIFIFIICLIIGLIILLNLRNNKSKNLKVGNNIDSQEIVENILNLKEYECEIDVEITSNKNVNKYKIKQNYIKDVKNEQEILEPQNIAGVKIIKDKNELKIENTRLSLINIYKNFRELTENNLDLYSFISDYNSHKESEYIEKQEQVLMNTESNDENKYQKFKTLYISKEDGKPIKMEIKDANKKNTIYIIYNRIDFKI